jgi:hypothetical protein
MRDIDSRYARMAAGPLLTLCVALVAGVSALDYYTGREMNVGLLYLAPIFIAAWGVGLNAAVAISIISMTAWFLAVTMERQFHAHPLLHLWHGAIQFAIFVTFAFVISRLKSALSHADERFATVLEGLNAAVYVSDVDSGVLLYANEQFHATFPEGTDYPTLRASAQEGEVRDEPRGRWYLVHARPIRWTDGRTVRLQLATDITERRQAEMLFRQQQEKMQLTARLVTAGEMAATIAHELNQPLAAITNYCQGCIRRLRSGAWSEPDLLDAMEKSAAQAERASQVVQRVRALVGRQVPNMILCDINEIVNGVSSIIALEARRTGAAFDLELSPLVPYVHADPVLMEQVVLNLCRNSIEAMRETPRVERQLAIRTKRIGDETVEVEVADAGRGIDPQLEENLFTPFFSTKSHGMGLGLHICRSIVEAHGGHVWMSRNAGRGVTFHFSLKAVQA